MSTFLTLADLKGRRALVTGGGGHIGRVVGEVLAELGARVVLVDKNGHPCRSNADQLNKISPCSAKSMVCDLSSTSATRKTLKMAIDGLGGLDILVHCAALVGSSGMPGWAVPFPFQSVAAWDKALRINTTSAFSLVQEAQKALSVSGKGSIIFISSIYGFRPPDTRMYQGTSLNNPAAYGVSKAGLVQLSRYLAVTLAPKVRVNCVSPGGVRRNQPLLFQKRYAQRTPLGRMAVENDLKGAIGFLASDLSSYVTGQDLVVDGGWSLW